MMSPAMLHILVAMFQAGNFDSQAMAMIQGCSKRIQICAPAVLQNFNSKIALMDGQGLSSAFALSAMSRSPNVRKFSRQDNFGTSVLLQRQI